MHQEENLRIVRVERDRFASKEAVAALLHLAFEGMPEARVLPANLRWLCWSGSRLIAHAAMRRSWFGHEEWALEGWVLGGVCTHPDAQQRGIGRRLLDRVHRDLAHRSLPFVVLNCGAHVRPFYEKLGYSLVSERGLYLRQNTVEIDDDPAMARALRPDFDVARLQCEAFPFVHEF